MKKVYEIEITTKAVVSVTAESEEEAFEAAWEETFKYGPDESECKTLTCVVTDFRGLAEEIAEILTDAEVGDPCDNSGGYTVGVFPNGLERTIEVYKDDDDGTRPAHYVVRCDFEDGEFTYDDGMENLSVDELAKAIQRFAEMEW